MAEVTVKKLLENAVHFGHHKTKWNPKMKKFIFGEKGKLHLIDVEKTKKYLEEALTFLEGEVKAGKTVLFVGTKPQVRHLLADMAKELGFPYVDYKWIAGLLTNFSEIERRIDRMKTLREEKENGMLEKKYVKKEVSKYLKELAKLEQDLGGVEMLSRTPDIVFVVDAFNEKNAVREAKKCHIPVVAIADTNADPDHVDYIIPANDDSFKSLGLLLGEVAKVCKKPGKKVEAKKMEETAA